MAPTAVVVALLGCVVLLAPACAAKEFVVTLDASNFEEEVSKHDFVVVEFYAPWCGHCKSLAPEYEKAAKTLSEEGSPVVLAKYDADNKANKAVAQKYGVQGFPTLKIFRNKDLDNPSDYKGPREAEGIVGFLKKLTGPPSLQLSSSDEIKERLESDSIIVVGVFSDFGTPEFEAYTKVADALRADFIFRHTADVDLLPEDHPKPTLPVVRVLQAFDAGYADSNDFEEEALTAFIKASTLPLVVEFSQKPKDRQFLARVFENQNKKALLFLSYSDAAASDFRAKYTEIAKSKPEGLSFVIGETAENDHALKYFGVAAEETPAVVIHDPKTNAKYYRTKIAPADLDDFFTSFLAGKEPKKLKSQPIPEKNDEAVKVLVGKNFKEEVLESGKNFLLEFYAPWCGHCQKLTPIYLQVAEEFKDDPDVVVAKMDYTENDLPTDQFTVQGFPTIYFFTSTGVVIPFNGDRTKKALVAFVKEQKAQVAANDSSATSAEEAEAAAEASEKAEEAAGKAEGKDEL